MISKESLRSLVIDALEELNRTRPASEQLGTSSEAPLYGRGGSLDSLGLLDLLMLVERRLAKALGAKVSLITSRAAIEHENPFETVGTLVDHLGRVAEAQRQAA